MKALIDEIKPRFTYSLHNAGFGGVFWYVTEDVPELFPELRKVPAKWDIPLHCGEPESPSVKVLSQAVTLADGIEKEYDYLESYGMASEDILKVIKGGTCSDAYSRERFGTFTLLTEMPYFYDARIRDLSDPDITRGQAMLDRLEWDAAMNSEIRRILAISREYMDENNPFLLAIVDCIDETADEVMRKQAREDPEYQKQATVAEKFDATLVSRFYKLLTCGMLIRANEAELAKPRPAGAEAALREAAAQAEKLHGELAERLEAEFSYDVIPISKLVAIQLESGLLAAEYFKDK